MMKRKQTVLCAILLLGIAIALVSCSDSTSSEDEWLLVWQDEFEGPSGQLPDAGKWDFDIGGDGWGNAQLEYNTDRAENVSLDGNGHLAIVAREESFGGNSYTSARINTRDLFEPTYGRIEARIKMPWGQGIWPAFWMLGADFPTVPWPQCGEIDIMEYRGQEPLFVHGSLHGPGYSGEQTITQRFSLVNDRFDTGFHTFALEWIPNEIKWFVDGRLYHTATPADVPGEWVYDGPFYIILNLAVGGFYVGSPDESTTFPQTLLVDYVRVYRAAP